MGRRGRRRERTTAPTIDYTDPEGNVLTLRAALSPATRREYEAIKSGTALSPGAAREDAWHRAAEFLFERLAARWVVAELPIDKQDELVARYRFASPAERDWILRTLRAHIAEHFPELDAP